MHVVGTIKDIRERVVLIKTGKKVKKRGGKEKKKGKKKKRIGNQMAIN